MPRCPACFTPLTRVVEAEIKSLSCSNCFGTWINAGSLLRRTQLDAREMGARGAGGGTPSLVADASIADLAEVIHASDSKDKLRCGECERIMAKEKFHPMIPVMVDRCHRCGCVWLDAGELMLVRRLYAELMNSDDPEVQRRRDKAASVAAAWVGHKAGVEQSREEMHKRGRYHRHQTTDDAFDLLGYLLRTLG